MQFVTCSCGKKYTKNFFHFQQNFTYNFSFLFLSNFQLFALATHKFIVIFYFLSIPIHLWRQWWGLNTNWKQFVNFFVVFIHTIHDTQLDTFLWVYWFSISSLLVERLLKNLWVDKHILLLCVCFMKWTSEFKLGLWMIRIMKANVGKCEWCNKEMDNVNARWWFCLQKWEKNK
jgi:hypothetical protein